MRKATLLSTIALTVFNMQAQADHQFIIKYKQQPSIAAKSVTRSFASMGLKVKSSQAIAGGAFVVNVAEKAGLAATSDKRVLQQLNQRPDVEYAVIDRQGHFKPLPKQPQQEKFFKLSHQLQWDEFDMPAGIRLESEPGKLDLAWSYSLGDAQKTSVVAVLDTGIEPHPALLDNLFKDNNGNIYGWNFANNDTNLADETGSYHGTHVAGTIAGYDQVMWGVGPKMKVLPLKIPGANGMFYESQVINAIYWAAGGQVPNVPENQHKARVINMSFGVDAHPGKELDYCDQALQEAVHYARNHGVVVVAAAGNDNVWENFKAPAICNGVVRVASTGPKGLRSYFSNYGPSVTFAAPGGDQRYGIKGGILSTVNPGGGYHGTGYDFYQGTSMASPHVAGLFGLVDSASPTNLSVKQIEQILYATTHDFGESNSDNDACRGKKPCGHGIVDAMNAIEAVNKGFTFFTIPSQAISHADRAWKKVDTLSDATASQTTPGLWQSGPGIIYAKAGANVYQFQPEGHAYCEIVGFDGIGCLQ